MTGSNINYMNEEQKHLVKLLKKAVNNVYKEKRFLLKYSENDRTGLEQAFTFRVGIYLNELIKNTKYKDFDLDSEYNKHLDGVKSSKHFPNGIRPDLIIHKRDSNNENKLVVEFKGWWNKNIKNDIKNDIEKLKDLTIQDEYKYLIGVFVKINKVKPGYRYFIKGVEVYE